MTTLLRNCRLPDGTSASIRLEGGLIVRIGDADGPAEEVIDVARRLVVPAFVDGHVHLDKTLVGAPWIPHGADPTVESRIAADRALRVAIDVPVEVRAAALIEQMIAFGTTACRTHVDIDTAIGLRHLHAILAVRERFGDRIDIEVVAFPQSGLLRDRGTADLLDAAIREGADLVGGLDPATIDGDAALHLEAVFGLAERHGVGLDIHLHEPAPVGYSSLMEIAARTEAMGLSGKVTISHAYCLGMVPDDAVARAGKALAKAGVAILTAAPGAAAIPPVRQLHELGVLVYAGSDNIRDAWSPFGNGSMLERAMLVAFRAGLRRDEDLALCFDFATSHGARALGLTRYGLTVGCEANLVVLEASSLAEAVVAKPRPAMVFRHGNLSGLA